jgi:hypothetical protein
MKLEPTEEQLERIAQRQSGFAWPPAQRDLMLREARGYWDIIAPMVLEAAAKLVREMWEEDDYAGQQAAERMAARILEMKP